MQFAGHEPLEGFDISGEVEIDALQTLLRTTTLMTPHQQCVLPPQTLLDENDPNPDYAQYLEGDYREGNMATGPEESPHFTVSQAHPPTPRLCLYTC